MKAKSIKGKSVEEIQLSLIEATADGFTPTLAFVFLSIEQEIEKVVEILNARDIQVFGATTEGGEISNSDLDKHSISILLLEINQEYFKILIEDIEDRGYNETTKSLAQQALKIYNNPAFLLSGSGVLEDPNLDRLVEGFKEVLGNEAPVFGGMAGDNLGLKESFVFTNQHKGNCTIVSVVFDADKVDIQGVAFHGWNSIGTTKTVTKSFENVVYAIDGEPALELIKRFAGIKELPDNLWEIQTELNHSLQIQLLREKGEPVMRGAIVNMEDFSLTFYGSMPEGSKIKFCLMADLDTIDETISVIQDFKNNQMTQADAVLVFECVGRQISFGPELNREFEGIYGVWNKPMAGMLSQGEIGPSRGGELEAHNLASCCVAIKEKS